MRRIALDPARPLAPAYRTRVRSNDLLQLTGELAIASLRSALVSFARS